MPANVATAPNFLLDSDYPLDKSIYLFSGSFVMPGATLDATPITHNLPFTPLVGGSWSLTSDFSVQYEYGSGTFPSENAGAAPFNQILTISNDLFGALDAGANGTDIRIGWENNSASSVTAYYRLYAFEPANVNLDTSTTASSGDNFVMNTDYNYTKLYNSFEQSVSGTGTVVLNHGLGYIPQADYWTRNATRVAPYTNYNVPNSGAVVECRIMIDSSNTTIGTNASIVNDVFGRIYVDEN